MDYNDFQNIISEWGWWITAAVLILFEILAPGVFFLFFAFAAFIVASIGWAFDIDWQYELLIFAAIGFGSMFAGRRYFKNERLSFEEHPINDPMAEYIGRVVELHGAVKNGAGEIKLGDSIWVVTGDDAEIGRSVKIIGKNDQKFIVEAVG